MEVDVKFELSPYTSKEFLEDIHKTKKGYERIHKVVIGNFFDWTLNYKRVIKMVAIGMAPVLLVVIISWLREQF